LSDVRSDYPGVLSFLLVDDGSLVEDGDHVCDVELMKNMFPVYANASGVITMQAKLGEIVAEGDVIATISDA
jgi:biotin carboxyl carrier protein